VAEEKEVALRVSPVDRCPVSPECTQTRLFQGNDGKVYRYDVRSNKFMPHTCNTRIVSEKPQLAYLGEWFNKRTQRTRWIGPKRMRKSVETPPKDQGFRKRGGDRDWELRQTWVATTDWKPVDD
jgi:hypothetical protein